MCDHLKRRPNPNSSRKPSTDWRWRSDAKERADTLREQAEQAALWAPDAELLGPGFGYGGDGAGRQFLGVVEVNEDGYPIIGLAITLTLVPVVPLGRAGRAQYGCGGPTGGDGLRGG